MRPRNLHILALGLLLAGGEAVVLAGPALAQVPEPLPYGRRGDGYTYYREYRSKEPLRGHEGFYGIGPNQRYCSYQRIPRRTCDKRGCRVTGWTLQQYCN